MDNALQINNHSHISNGVKNELVKLSIQKQEDFQEEFNRKRKSILVAYICWVIFGLHYAYLNKWGVQVAFWLTGGGLGVWWLIDLFRVPALIKNRNKDTAIEVLRNIKAISM